jgi:hypothetical protein
MITACLGVRPTTRSVWVAALIDEDVWTYVANTGKFHRNEGVREDYFMLNRAEYSEIGISEARRLLDTGVGTVDERRFPDSVPGWRDDREAMETEIVFASLAADIA